MGIKYAICQEEVQQECEELMEHYHDDLVRSGLKVLCVYASASEGTAAVKLHGRPCYATVRKVAARDRALGMPDAVITIDSRRWKDLDERQRTALLDHELTHLTIKLDEDGEYALEDDGRPKIEMREHDWELHGFADVVKRHGACSLELLEIGSFRGSDDGQLVFGFIDKLIASKKSAA